MSVEKNRRESFRIDDNMHLILKILTDDELSNIELDFNSYRLKHCLMSHLVLQRDNRKANLCRVRKRSPDVARYLELLEDDLLLLAGRLAEAAEGNQLKILTNVNISSTSLRMETEGTFEEGQSVELFMTLSTGGTNVLLIAEVVRVDEFDNLNSVALRFKIIHPDDEEAIIRHMAKLQQLLLQARRSN
jgi:hypothetical protein